MNVNVTLPLRLRSVMNLREHWRRRAERAQTHRVTARAQMRSACPKPELPAVITIIRLAPRKLDTDNLAASAKAVRDGIADWLGVDDADERVTWCYEQRQQQGYAVLVEARSREECA